MSTRTLLPAILVLVCSCGAPERDPAYALTITGPTGPFRGALEVTAIPEPADGTVEVRFEVDGEERAVDGAAPFAASIDLSHDWGGSHHITAVAHRDDGATAEASMEVTYDPLGPFVTLVKPATGVRVSPAGSMLDVVFAASDLSGLAAGAVQLGDGAPTAVPLPSLTLSIEVPKSVALPTKPELSWWFDDTVGNRTQGSIGIEQSYERFSTTFESPGQVLPLPDRRFAVVSPSQVRAFEPDGRAAWTLAAPAIAASSALSVVGGDLVVAWSAPDTALVQRIHPDGTVAWAWSTKLTIVQAMAYVAESDSLVMLVKSNESLSTTASLLGPTGKATLVKTYPTNTGVALVVTPPGVSPGGFALGSPYSSTMARYEVFDAAGAPAWSFDLANFSTFTTLLTRDVLFGPVSVEDPKYFALVGPQGIVADLGDVDASLTAANGDVVIGTHTATTNAVSRLRPDGSTVWNAQLPAPVLALSGGNDRFGVTTVSSLHVVDAAGGVVQWIPDADPMLPTVLRAELSPADGFYVLGDLTSTQHRVYRAGADGTTLWHETLFDSDQIRAEPLVSDDKRLVVSVQSPTTTTLHLFEP
ncbi:Hypothetical protein A7982_08188 [Minicystis rosea]|nr:Hypothetical protein A7982_08188 [Minicystis rosea]